MKRWWVVTHTAIAPWGQPPDLECDVVRVEAPNKRRARVEGVRALRREYPNGVLRDFDNPFAAIARIEPDTCSHGTWEDRCEQCEREWETTCAVCDHPEKWHRLEDHAVAPSRDAWAIDYPMVKYECLARDKTNGAISCECVAFRWLHPDGTWRQSGSSSEHPARTS